LSESNMRPINNTQLSLEIWPRIDTTYSLSLS
jgi:hypothetical protein